MSRRICRVCQRHGWLNTGNSVKIVNVMLAKGKGGMEAVAVQYARLLQEAGFQSTFVCHCRSPYAAPPGVPRFPIPSASRCNPLAYLALWRALWKIRPDQIWCHGARALSFCRAIRFALPRDVLLIGVAHNARTGKLCQADRVIAVSQNVRDELTGRWSLPEDNVICAPNAIHIPESVCTVRHTPPVIGFLGRMDPIKGVDTLLAAAELLAERGAFFRLLMAGDGPSAGRYRECCRELGLADRVSWAGWIEDKQAFFNAVDVFCMPSRSEGMGLSLLEAMAHGRPVVGSDCAAVKELVTESGAGIVFPIGDANALVDALEGLLSADDARYHELSRCARDFASKDYSEVRLRNDLAAVANRYKSGALPTEA